MNEQERAQALCVTVFGVLLRHRPVFAATVLKQEIELLATDIAKAVTKGRT